MEHNESQPPHETARRWDFPDEEVELCAPPRFMVPFSIQPQGAERLAQTLPRKHAEAIELVATSIRSKCIVPALRAGSGEGYLAVLRERGREFMEALRAMNTLVELALPEDSAADLGEAAVDGLDKTLAECANRLSGAEAVAEVDFANQTYRRAIRLARGLRGQPVDPDRAEEDKRLAAKFWAHSALHNFGLLSILAAQDEHPVPDVLETAFGVTRAGALAAYAAARMARDLRRPATEGAQQMVWLGMDDDDLLLADAD